MTPSTNEKSEEHFVNVIHDLQRQILEVPSLFRVINNYFQKKTSIQEKIEPLLKRRIREGLNALQTDKDWLFSITSSFSTLSEDVFLSSKDSFRFPDSIILFEAWMNLGIKALFPRVAVQFKVPGLLKNEKTRNVFQFIYATSRGFGWPIYFGPEFYGYKLTIGKILEPLFRWSHTLCHRANQGITLLERKFNSKRHHPGEFESVIISEYEDNHYKGIDTLLHGYFTNEPQELGQYNSLREVLDDVIFSYTIGDHAMSVEKENSLPHRQVKLITHEEILNKYDIDFFSYIEKLMSVVKVITLKIDKYKQKRKELIKTLKLLDKIRFRLDQSKRFSIPWLKMSSKFADIYKYDNYKHLMEKLRNLIWTTPLYSHTVHDHVITDESEYLTKKTKEYDEFEHQTQDSLLLAFIKHYELENDFKFEEEEVIRELKQIRDHMAKMWLYFKERYYRYAKRKLDQLVQLPLGDPNYGEIVKEVLDKVLPIISIYEIFHRPLSESAYPEADPYARSAIAIAGFRFITSRYNPMGLNLIKLFNRLAFRNWSYFIKKNEFSFKQFFILMLKIPIWKHLPELIKNKILDFSQS